MLKFFVLLISCCITTGVHCQEIISGFATSTIFTDKAYAKSTAEVGVNTYISITDYLTFKSQISTNGSPAQIALFEFMPGILPRLTNDFGRTEVTIQAGRYARLNAFHNDTTDNPGTYDVAILPIGVYPLQLVDAKLTLADGVNIKAVKEVLGGLLCVRLAIGTSVVSKPLETDTALVIAPNSLVVPTKHKADDIVIQYEKNNVKLYISDGTYQYTSNDPSSYKLNNNVLRTGITYNIDKFSVESEFIHIYTTNTGVNNISIKHNYTGADIIIHYAINDKLSAYISESTGSRPSDHMKVSSSAIGVNYEYEHGWVFSAELQHGSGSAWPLSMPRSAWNTGVLSISRRF